MNNILLKLDISISYNPVERRGNLVEPLNEILKDNGRVLFSIPGFTILADGSKKWDDVILDISLQNLFSISLIKDFLSKNDLLDKSRLSIRTPDYNLLDYV